jgi:hypothetical protein
VYRGNASCSNGLIDANSSQPRYMSELVKLVSQALRRTGTFVKHERDDKNQNPLNFGSVGNTNKIQAVPNDCGTLTPMGLRPAEDLSLLGRRAWHWPLSPPRRIETKAWRCVVQVRKRRRVALLSILRQSNVHASSSTGLLDANFSGPRHISMLVKLESC